MPTYEYLCETCGERLERFQSMSATPLRSCPACGGELRRLVGPGGGILVRGASSRGTTARPERCGRDRPCCGRDQRCGTPPCEER